MNWGKAGREYWQNELQNMMGIKQGNMAPTELPEFKGMQSMWNSNMDNVLQNAIRQLSQSGVQGGKANQMLSSLQQGNQSGLLSLIQNIYNQVNQRGGVASDKGIDWQKFLMNYDLASDAQKAQNRQTDFNQWAGGIKTAMAMGAAAAPMGGGLSMAAAAPMGGGQTGGVAGTGGLADWYKKMYGG